jgi:hypothetical protein
MEFTEFTMKLIILFLPGIIATTIVSSLISRSKLSNRDYAVSVILLGFTSYFTANILHNIVIIIEKRFDNYKYLEPEFIRGLLEKDFNFNLGEVLFACLCAVAIGFITTKIINFGVLHSFARKINISNSTSEEDTWGSLFYNCNKGIKNWVYIIDKDLDIVYGGYVTEHSRDHNENELLLENVVCYKNSNRDIKLREFDKLYISKNKNDLIIEMKEVVIKNEQDSDKAKRKKSKPNS